MKMQGLRILSVVNFFCIFPIFLVWLCYYLNVNDRMANQYECLKISIIFFLCISIVIYTLIHFLEKLCKYFSYAYLAFDIIFVALCVLAVLFPVEHILLDGKEVADVPFGVTIKQVCIFIVVFLLTFLFCKVKRDEFIFLKHAFSIFCCIFILYAAVQMDKDANAALPSTMEEKNFTFGDRNVILLVTETLQGNYFKEIFDESPEIFSEFTGMTLFDKAVTATNWSPFSTNQIFRGGNNWQSFQTRAEAVQALEEDSLITDARKYGFRFSGGRYTPVKAQYFTGKTEDSNIPFRVRLPKIILTNSRYYFAAFRRVIPAVLWPRINKLEMKIFWKYLGSGQYPNKISAKNNLLHIKNTARKSSGNAFFYFFNYMTHREILFDRNGTPVPGLPQNKDTQKEEYRYAVALYGDFFAKLKKIGVYDDALIVITGDHGTYDEPFGSYNPAVFVKPPHAQGGLRVSSANLLLSDLRALIAAYMHDDAACEAGFTGIAAAAGPRRFDVFVYRPSKNILPGNKWENDNGTAYVRIPIEGDIATVRNALKAHEKQRP